ncbi:hypothetical protein A6U86_34085 [Rhizobium sp. AC27/96]|nr:hypothetical protein A6U86_34085 [Rhizobium sp. AC27/96]
MFAVKFEHRFSMDQKRKIEPLVAIRLYQFAPLAGGLPGIQGEESASLLLDNGNGISVGSNTMFLGVEQKVMGRLWNLDLAPIERHLPDETFADDRIDFHVSPQQVSSNPGIAIGRANIRSVDHVCDGQSQMVGGEVDPVRRFEYSQCIINL